MHHNKVAFFVLNRELGPFILAMKNAKAMVKAGKEVVIVLEDKGTALLFEMKDTTRLFSAMFEELVQAHMVVVCRACAVKTEALFAISGASKIKLVGDVDVDGHVSMNSYVDKGFQIITV